MELHSEGVITLNDCREFTAIVCDGNCLGSNWRSIRMRVIDERSRLDIAQQARSSQWSDLVPANVRSLDAGRKALTYAVERAQPAHVWGLLAAFKHPLHADADAKERNACRDRALYH